MHRFIIISALLGMLAANAPVIAAAANTPTAGQPAPVSQPGMAENPAVTRRALEWVGRFQSTNIDRSQLDATIDAKLTPQVLAAMKRQLAPLGTPTGIGYGGGRSVKGNLVYRYVVVFPVGAIQEFISIDNVGKIAGVLFLPVR